MTGSRETFSQFKKARFLAILRFQAVFNEIRDHPAWTQPARLRDDLDASREMKRKRHALTVRIGSMLPCNRSTGSDNLATSADSLYLGRMNVDLTPDQQAFIRRAIDSGRFHREEEAVQEALALWEERERRRAEILAALDEAEASLAGGEGRSRRNR